MFLHKIFLQFKDDVSGETASENCCFHVCYCMVWCGLVLHSDNDSLEEEVLMKGVEVQCNTSLS